jgi:hypothetical protein
MTTIRLRLSRNRHAPRCLSAPASSTGELLVWSTHPIERVAMPVG